MTIEEIVLQKLRGLPPEKQRVVVDFMDSLKANGEQKPLRNLEGLLEDLNLDFSEEDIAQARTEMWGAFPREIS